MPKVNVEQKSSLSPKETFSKLKDFFENDEGLRKLDSNYTCTFNDAQLTGDATGKQFKANMSVVEVSEGARVDIVVDLPILLSPFKSKVKETLERKLSKLLA